MFQSFNHSHLVFLAWGFLPGKEVKAAGVGNLGLWDRAYYFRQGSVPMPHTLLFSRTCRSQVGEQIYLRLRWRPHQGHDVRCHLPSIARLIFFYNSWGESAGAISVALQMLHKGGDTEGLFRAGFMQSGSPIPVGDIANGQVCELTDSYCPFIRCLTWLSFAVDYDEIVANTGCSSASDTLACLRTVPFAKLKAAVDLTPGIFAYQVSVSLLAVRESRH
jgi:hypothetical protein